MIGIGGKEMDDRPIARLDNELIGKIAAGEVVENPASAVKEMVENSLDSGAKSITVEVREGGIAYIRVTDNGRGIRNRDIRMAFERHATSKIVTTDDLFHLSTLGFRGEALASIAAVSKLTLTTHRVGESVGTRAQNEGGMILDITEAAAPQGTTIVVKELFYNTPVRLKFLKKPTTEASKVADVMQRFILSRPDISFRFISNGRQVYQSSGNGDLKSAIFCLYGRETAENMLPVKAEGSISIKGMVGVGAEARSNRNRQTFIINGRCIRSLLLSQALEEAAKERYTIGHYPTCVLSLSMPATLVDVNVHPNKLEVRFSDENLVYQKVFEAVSGSFSESLLGGAPTITEPGNTPPPPIPMRVIPTGSTEGKETAAKIISQEKEMATGTVIPEPAANDVPGQPKEATTGAIGWKEATSDVPGQAKEATTGAIGWKEASGDIPGQTGAATPNDASGQRSTSPGDKQQPVQDDQDFASIVTNYFSGNYHPDSGSFSAPGNIPVQQAEPERNSEIPVVSGTPDQEQADASAATLSGETLIRPEPTGTNGAEKEPTEQGNAGSVHLADIYPPKAEEPVEYEQLKFAEVSPAENKKNAFAGYDYVGTAFDTYIIMQNSKQLLLIDQHAAHERILYEKLMKQVDIGNGSQLLLIPQVVHVTPQEAIKLETYKEEIAAAGYEIEPFGDQDYQIRAVPNVLGEPETKAAFLEMLDRLGELRVLSTKQKRRDAILQMACKKAIKGGDKLEMTEIYALLEEMQRTGAPPTCPHGRPLVVILSRTELEKKFKRINE